MVLHINKDYMGCFGEMRKRLTPRAIVIHHTCTRTPKGTRATLKTSNCSTHFEVDKDGTIYQYRECNLQCSHCGSNNFHCIGIDVTHMEGAEFPAAQVAAVRELVLYLCAAYNIPCTVYDDLPAGIYSHRAIGNTKCPDNFPLEALQ